MFIKFKNLCSRNYRYFIISIVFTINFDSEEQSFLRVWAYLSIPPESEIVEESLLKIARFWMGKQKNLVQSPNNEKSKQIQPLAKNQKSMARSYPW